MKKRISIILAICFVVSGIAVAAALSNGMLADQDAKKQQESIYSSYDKKPVYKGSLSDPNENIVFEKVNRSGKDKSEIYDDIFAYKHFKKLYKPTEENIKYLDSLIVKGADIPTVIDIYDFWLTTSDDISIVGQIYDLSIRKADAYWIEDAFNQITGNKHGVLDRAGIDKYLSERVAAEDIKIANVLSRKGVLTITEILDRYAEGEEWPSIIRYIYQNNPGKSGNISAQSNLPSDKDTSFKTLDELMTYIRFVNIDPPQSETLSREAKENPSSMKDDIKNYKETLNGDVYAELLADGVFVRDEAPENQAAINKYKEKIRKNGVSDAQIETLLDNGYNVVDILNASEESQSSGKDINNILKSKRDELISNKGGTVR